MHMYKTKIVLFFVLLIGINIKTSENTLEFAKKLQESDWIDLSEMNPTNIVIDNTNDVLNNIQELNNDTLFTIETLGVLGEKIKYVATNYPLHILAGCFISKLIYDAGVNYYKNLKDKIEVHNKRFYQEKLDNFFIKNVSGYKEKVLELDKAYDKAIRDIKIIIDEFPFDKIPQDIRDIIKILKDKEEIYPTKQPQFDYIMIENIAEYMLQGEQASFHNWQCIDLLLKVTMRKQAVNHILKKWKNQNKD